MKLLQGLAGGILGMVGGVLVMVLALNALGSSADPQAQTVENDAPRAEGAPVETAATIRVPISDDSASG
ncbi:hypothetical protein [Erythrobacter sp. THAF29]|uniref:hypothetical protein n=1 Tax=Erythrobacter sp. THAF29 TaxID=2587851 RepID=UPI0012694E98|nr:hypothetical protein [Erythrobacter sp. THAF29]QFT76648.1 hypothetical protein FIU90_03725 [Erythrobacter sp. THAF29]